MGSVHSRLCLHRRWKSGDGSMIQPVDEGLYRSIHHAEEGSGIETDPENHDRQGRGDDGFTQMQVSDGILDGLADGAEHRPFVVPEEIGGTENHAGHGDGTIEPMSFERAEQDQELANKSIGAGQADGGNPISRKNVASNGVCLAIPPKAESWVVCCLV